MESQLRPPSFPEPREWGSFCFRPYNPSPSREQGHLVVRKEEGQRSTRAFNPTSFLTRRALTACPLTMHL